MTNLGLSYLAHKENERSNLAKEAETYRHNLATEGVSKASLEESIRHSKVSEGETATHNRATETQAREELGEEKRSHLVNEAETNRSHLASEGEARRHNTTTEDEAHRHNIFSEGFEQRSMSNAEIQTFLNNLKDNPLVKTSPWGALVYGVANVATAGSKVEGFSGLGSAIQEVLETGSVDPAVNWLSKTVSGLRSSDLDSLSDLIVDLVNIPREQADNIVREINEGAIGAAISRLKTLMGKAGTVASTLKGFVDFIKDQFDSKANVKPSHTGGSNKVLSYSR